MKYNLVESFSGPGGMSLGLKEAGFELSFAFDIDAKTVETHNYNLENKCFQFDVREVTKNLIHSKIAKKELDLFAGGPPCQGFSKQKRGAHLGDPRNQLVEEYIRLVFELTPRFFFFENVAIFGQKRGSEFIKLMRTRLVDYSLQFKFYNSADFGLAQTRERFILIGMRKDQKSSFAFPHPKVKRWKTVGEVLSGLPEPPLDYTVHPKFPNHQATRITPINVERFSYVPQGGGWKDIPDHLRLPCHRNADTSKGGWPDVYGRLEWGGQCPTITGGFDSFTRGRYGHPLANRALTPREAARLQGFPDHFVFLGNRGDVRSQIGNAVPPPLAAAIGKAIMKSLLIADGFFPKRSHHTPSDEAVEQLSLLSY